MDSYTQSRLRTSHPQQRHGREMMTVASRRHSSSLSAHYHSERRLYRRPRSRNPSRYDTDIFWREGRNRSSPRSFTRCHKSRALPFRHLPLYKAWDLAVKESKLYLAWDHADTESKLYLAWDHADTCTLCNELSSSIVLRCTEGLHGLCKTCCPQYLSMEIQKVSNDILTHRGSISIPCLFGQFPYVMEESFPMSSIKSLVAYPEILKQIADIEKNVSLLNDPSCSIETHMRIMFPNGHMCRHCKLGPVDLQGCSDLTSHNGQIVSHNLQTGQKVKVNNSCMRCGWFAPYISDWLPWDGILEAEWDGLAATPVPILPTNTSPMYIPLLPYHPLTTPCPTPYHCPDSPNEQYPGQYSNAQCTSPAYSPTSPAYYPTYSPTSPTYSPTRPTYCSTRPTYPYICLQ